MSENIKMEPGLIIQFGHSALGNIECLLLDMEEFGERTIYTLASKKPITCRRYNETACSWSKSEIREWLNNEFYNGFAMKDNIMPVELETGKYGCKNITEKTTDKIWLFSEHELGVSFVRPWDVDEGESYPFMGNTEILKEMMETDNPSFILRSPDVYLNGEVVCVKDGKIELCKAYDEMPIMIGFKLLI